MRVLRAPSEPGEIPSPADLFTVMWDRLVDVLGTSATAALLRRAARAAIERCPELSQLLIVREGLAYAYTVPASWRDRGDVPPALRALAQELHPLLVEMTGLVVVRHLARAPGLREAGLVAVEEERPS